MTEPKPVWEGSTRPEDNLGLVYKMAARYAERFHIDAEEFIAEGYFALCRASERFDPSMGIRFSTYACRAISSAIVDQITGRRTKAQRPLLTIDPKTLNDWRPGDDDPVARAARRELIRISRDFIESIDHEGVREMADLMARGHSSQFINKICGLSATGNRIRARRRRAIQYASRRVLVAVEESSIDKRDRRPGKQSRKLRSA